MTLPDFSIRLASLVLVLLAGSFPLCASEQLLHLQLESGQEIEVRRFPGGSESLVLWLPSERGINDAHAIHAARLAALGHETWLVDLHDNYFVERNRNSISRFPLDDVVSLIDVATRTTAAGVVLIGSSRGAQLALIAAREWQLKNPGKARIKGVFLVHPYLYEARPGIGESATYLPITRATNLPVYLLDTQYSTRGGRIHELSDRLGAAGSRVYTQVLKGVQGGFFAREYSEISARDRVARKEFATTIHRAIGAMELVPTPHSAVASTLETRLFSRNPLPGSRLKMVETPIPAPPLQLDDLNAHSYSLKDSDGQVLLINFWATWCRPCVEEIPSLHRLRAVINNPEFEIITVNVGEGRQRIANFIEQVPIQLPLLLDNERIVANAWKIYVYPSSYLVDRDGQIRYAYLGALEWDSPENVTIIESLLKQP